MNAFAYMLLQRHLDVLHLQESSLTYICFAGLVIMISCSFVIYKLKCRWQFEIDAHADTIPVGKGLEVSAVEMNLQLVGENVCQIYCQQTYVVSGYLDQLMLDSHTAQ